jgi:hypothetical protein
MANLANQTYEVPMNLGDILGAYDTSHWLTVVMQLKPSVGVLVRGTVLSLVAGKLEKTVAANQGSAYGILLDASIDTAATFTGGSVTGSVARAGSFRDPPCLSAWVLTRLLCKAFCATMASTSRDDHGAFDDGGDRGSARGRDSPPSARAVLLKLGIYFLAKGRYWTPGESIPDELVSPDIAARYGVQDTLTACPAELGGQTPGTHVKRGRSFKRISDPEVTIEPAEPTYRRLGKAFIPASQ